MQSLSGYLRKFGPVRGRDGLLVVALVYLLASPWQMPHANLDHSKVFHFFDIGFPGLVFHWPTVFTGDEPHHLVVINSLLQDGDLDLKNNYVRARSGEWDAGLWYRNYNLDIHARTTVQGHLYSTHAIGMPVIISVFLIPFRGTPWVESFAVLTCTFAALLGLFFMGRVLDCQKHADLSGPAIMLAGLATPVFVYARGLWTENFVILGFFAVLWLSLGAGNRVWIVMIVAATMFSRYASGILFAALLLWELWRRKRTVPALALGLAAGLAAILLYQRLYFADVVTRSAAGPVYFPVRFVPGNFLEGFVGSLFDPVKGLLVFSPVLAFGFLGLLHWLRQRESLPVILLVTAGLQIVLISLYQYWDGGVSYSSRYLHPAILPLAIGSVKFWRRSSATWVRLLFVGLLFYSAAINLYAGFLPLACYDRSPVEIATHLYRRVLQGAGSRVSSF